MARITGQYRDESSHGEVVRPFNPFPLPPVDPELDLNFELKELIQRAGFALKELTTAQELIPSLNCFVYSFIRKEVLISSQIEGTQATLTDVFSVETNLDLEEVCNYLSAFQYALSEMAKPTGLPISMRLINKIHALLMNGARGRQNCPARCAKVRTGLAELDQEMRFLRLQLRTNFQNY